jgi:crotonobetaine/carnitine-CoA ligase
MPELLRRLVSAEQATVAEVLLRRVEESAQRTFLLWAERVWSYEDALKEISAFAGFVESHTRRDDRPIRVASYLPNMPEALWTWLGTHLAGATYVPLNRAHRGAILEKMISSSRAQILVTDHEGLMLLEQLQKVRSLKQIVVVDLNVEPGEVSGYPVLSYASAQVDREPNRRKSRRPSDVATVMYTSGTTGGSKGVLIPHNMFCRGAARFAHGLGMRDDDVAYCSLPLYHIFGQLHVVMSAIIAGACVGLSSGFSRSRFWSEVDAYRATIFAGLGSMLHLLLDLPPAPNDRAHTLRIGVVGNPPPALQSEFEQRFALRVIPDNYGMTEVEPVTVPDPVIPAPLGSCGRVNPDFEVQIVDEEDRAVAAGVTGEIVVRPRAPHTMFSGYDGAPAATITAWRNLWFHTGDLAYISKDGFLYFVDRRKHAIRRRGENISSIELERIVLDHPDVRQCAAVGVAALLGEEDVKLVIVPEDDRTIAPPALLDWCMPRMARFMLPRYIEIRETLPHLAFADKVNKSELRTVNQDTWDAEKESGGRNQ